MLPAPGAKFWLRDERLLSTGLNFSPAAASVLVIALFRLAPRPGASFLKPTGVAERPAPVGVPTLYTPLSTVFMLWCEEASRSVLSLLLPSCAFPGVDLNELSFFAWFFHFVTAGKREPASGG